ncbi:MAG: PocR ligand-binding domain-containing protein [Candidatus Zixiibacteriota bacterium]
MKLRRALIAVIGILMGVFFAIPAYVFAFSNSLELNGLFSIVAIHQYEPFLYITDIFSLIIAISVIANNNKNMKLAVNKSRNETENKSLREELEKVRYNLNEAIDEKRQIKDDFQRTTAKLRLRLKRMVSIDFQKKPVTLNDIIDLETFQELQDSVSGSLNVYSAVYDATGELITRPTGFQKACRLVQRSTLGEKECYWFQRNLVEKAFAHGKPVFKQCHLSGLVCGGVPIVINDRHLGTWMLGQAKVMPINEDELAHSAAKMGTRIMELLGAHKMIPKIPVAHFEAMLNMIWGFSRELSALAHGNIRLSQNSHKLKKAENESQMLWSALNLSSDAIIIYNHDGQILSANETVCNLLGYSRKQMHEFKIMDLVESEKVLKNLSQERSALNLKNSDGREVIFSAIHKASGYANQEINIIIASPETEKVTVN